MIIEGFWWFVAALVVCGWHTLHIRAWRKERREGLAWFQRYEREAVQRHREFMQVMAPHEGATAGDA